MPRVIRRISTIVYGLGIVGALAFGANEALGRAVSDTCLYKPPALLGACIGGLEQCQDSCDAYGTYTARCVDPGNCCECFAR